MIETPPHQKSTGREETAKFLDASFRQRSQTEVGRSSLVMSSCSGSSSSSASSIPPGSDSQSKNSSKNKIKNKKKQRQQKRVKSLKKKRTKSRKVKKLQRNLSTLSERDRLLKETINLKPIQKRSQVTPQTEMKKSNEGAYDYITHEQQSPRASQNLCYIGKQNARYVTESADER